MKENGLILKNAKSGINHAETIVDTDYADDSALLINTSALGESLMHSLEQAVRGIDQYVNPDKQFMCFKQEGTTAHQMGSLSNS